MEYFNVLTTIEKAETIVKLARVQPEIAKTLSACAVLVLAAALEQGTKSKLSYVAKLSEMEEGIKSSETEAGWLYLNGSLRQRMNRLPVVLTDGRIQLIQHHPVVRSLHRLISVRNWLHIDEPAKQLLVPDQQVVMEPNRVTVTYAVPVPKSPWTEVSVSDSEDFLSAVKVYFAEVLFPDPNQIEPLQL